MTAASTLAFAATLFVMALAPGPGVATIVSRTLKAGLAAGLAASAGVTLGDLLYLNAAVAGLAAVATAIGPYFRLVKYAGALYLLWLGWQALASSSEPVEVEGRPAGTLWREVALGLFITLGNPKTILMYGAIMPSIVDFGHLGVTDLAMLCAIVVAVLATVFLGYVVLADRARATMRSAAGVRRFNLVTGAVLIGAGLYVATH